jgi:hypothetical protein
MIIKSTHLTNLASDSPPASFIAANARGCAREKVKRKRANNPRIGVRDMFRIADFGFV